MCIRDRRRHCAAETGAPTRLRRRAWEQQRWREGTHVSEHSGLAGVWGGGWGRMAYEMMTGRVQSRALGGLTRSTKRGFLSSCRALCSPYSARR
eukprot:305141-Rhodomonas_salina.1